MKDRGLIVAVSGPSGVGKGTVLARVEELMEQAAPGSVGHSISVTTRAPRGQEQDGVEYYFRTKDEFEQMIKDGKIVEYVTEYAKAFDCVDHNKLWEILKDMGSFIYEILFSH